MGRTAGASRKRERSQSQGWFLGRRARLVLGPGPCAGQRCSALARRSGQIHLRSLYFALETLYYKFLHFVSRSCSAERGGHPGGRLLGGTARALPSHPHKPSWRWPSARSTAKTPTQPIGPLAATAKRAAKTPAEPIPEMASVGATAGATRKNYGTHPVGTSIQSLEDAHGAQTGDFALGRHRQGNPKTPTELIPGMFNLGAEPQGHRENAHRAPPGDGLWNAIAMAPRKRPRSSSRRWSLGCCCWDTAKMPTEPTPEMVSWAEPLKNYDSAHRPIPETIPQCP